MWIFKYFACVMRSHAFAAIHVGTLPYQYCLRCGKFEKQQGHPLEGSVDVRSVGEQNTLVTECRE